jgi:hypothetical protein
MFEGVRTMVEISILPLKTFDGRPLMNKFYRHESDPSGLLITFPGNHYGVDGPLLYYPSEMLGETGWDTLAVSYGYKTAGMEFGHEVVPGILEECQRAMEFMLGEFVYPRIGLLGKSLGCLVIAQLCNEFEGLVGARCGYLTPPLGTPFFDQIFLQTTQPAHLAIGTKDRFYDPQTLEALQETRSFGLTLIEDADHSMNILDNLEGTLQAIGRVTRDVVEFFMEVGEQ